jgi:hypothetical protein
VPFGFFKKKESEKRGEPAAASSSVVPEMPLKNVLSVNDVQRLLDDIESTKVQLLSAKLTPIRDAASDTLESLASIADGMEKEKLKLEDLEKRFGSNIENAKKTVVSALRREISNELPQVQTLSDAKKFKDRLESMMQRFGEVTGSHSKMLNYFLKKYASSIKHELGELEDLLKDVKSAISTFEQERAPAVKCSTTLNTILQKVASAKADKQAAQTTLERINLLEGELGRLKEELAVLLASSEYAQSKMTAEKLAAAEKKQEQFHAQVAEAFSHVTRALSKYSYGVSRDTERRLKVLSEEPWQALVDQDISPYSLLIAEVYKSVSTGQIQLKDSDRVLQHLASIQSLLPQMQKDAVSISAELESLFREKKVDSAVRHARELETSIVQHEEGIARERQLLGQLERQDVQTNSEVDALLNDVSDSLLYVTGKNYAVVVSADVAEGTASSSTPATTSNG